MKAVQIKEDEGRSNKQSSDKKNQLPSRQEFHRKKKKSRKTKQRPFLLIRTLLIFFVFIVIGAFSYFYFGLSSKIENVGGKWVSGEESAYEEFEYEIGSNEEDASSEINSSKENKQEENETESVIIEQEEENDQLNPAADQKVEEKGQHEGQETANNYQSSDSKGQQIDSDLNAKEREVIHIVQKGETLFRISMKYYESRNGEEIIRERNNLRENEIYEGQKLVIPLQ
ncbi:LysM peptidoglycan-binding domain-containing protein [Bacillus taeanensis]|nr:LysM peptidoglycan-binding domain-containing protein [Bacillus taeanensis]